MNTGETIALIKAFGNGSGSSLPPVTATDNGKVLTVEDGAWAAADNLLLVNVRLIPQYTKDKTFAEITTALSVGKEVVLKDQDNKTYTYFGIGMYGSPIFTGDFTNPTTHYIQINPDESIYYYTSRYLPLVNSANNGSELIVKNGVWVAQAKKFLVTLTPTALDYSGTMDKTVAEINAAYEAGMEIVVKVLLSATESISAPLSAVHEGNATYPGFRGYLIQDAANMLVQCDTGLTNDGTKQTYSTIAYSLTPAS